MYKVMAIMFIGFAIALSTAISVNVYSESQKDIAAINNGLQECLETSSTGFTHTLWKKECK